MIRIANAIIFLFFNIISRNEAKVDLDVHIYNYRNVDNLKHDGGKCESLHWLNDHCDPMFSICISSLHPCDVLNKKIDFWRNKKTLYTVFQGTIELNKFPKSISVKVKVDDHDQFDGHDHIAVFASKFVLNSTGHTYRDIMQVTPRGLNVGLQASVLLKCSKDYYGPTCDLSKIENECINNCGHGKCLAYERQNMFICQCDIGWSGPQCRTFIVNDCSLLKCEMDCKYTEILKECICISNGNNKKICREKLISLKKTTVQLYIPTTTASTISQADTSTKYTTSSSTEKTTRYLTTDSFSRKQSSQPERNLELPNKETPLPPDSVKSRRNNLVSLNQPKPADSHKLTNTEITGIRFAPSTVIIISLLLLLCLCVLGLLIVIRKWHTKNNKKFLWSTSIQRPLPPIIYKNPESSFKSYTQRETDFPPKINSGCGSSTLASESKRNSNLLTVNNYEIESFDPYEEPIICNMESLTCETEYDNSDDGDMYEEPIKLKI